jgi:hypothetical protein
MAAAAGVGLSHYFFSDFEHVTPALGDIRLGQCERVMRGASTSVTVIPFPTDQY